MSFLSFLQKVVLGVGVTAFATASPLVSFGELIGGKCATNNQDAQAASCATTPGCGGTYRKLNETNGNWLVQFKPARTCVVTGGTPACPQDESVSGLPCLP